MAKKSSSGKASKKPAKKSKAPAKSARKAAKKAKKTTKRDAKKTTPKSAKKSAKKSTKTAAKKTAKKTSSGKSRNRKKPKSPLSRKEMKEFRELLLQKRRDLVGDMTGMEAGAFGRQEGTGDLSNMPTHPADIGSDNYEQEFTLGLLESERAVLQEIDQALERIEEGTYGICLGTGDPIGKPRLRARPWAKYCIDYARQIEKGLVEPPDEDDPPYGREDDEDEEED